MENIKEVIILAAVLFPFVLLAEIAFIGFVILILNEEDIVSPSSMLMIYRKKLVSILKRKTHGKA